MNFLARLARARPFYYRNHLFALDASAAIELSDLPLTPNYRLEFPVDPATVRDEHLAEVGWTRAMIEERARAGDQLGLVWRGERIAHRTLVQRAGWASMEGDRAAFHVGARDVYVHSCYTSPDDRGHGLYPAMLRTAARYYARTEPATRIYIACRQENAPSVKAIRRAGFRYLRSSRVLGLAGGRLRLRRWYETDAMRDAREPGAAAGRRLITNERTLWRGAGVAADLPWSSRQHVSYGSGREALVALFEALQLGADDVVLLPAYVPEGLVAPCRSRGIGVRLYPVDRELDPDWEALGQFAAESRPKLAVLIHYFGVPRDAARFAAACRPCGAQILEDLAHAQVLPESPLGASADYVLHSLPKVVGVPDGAILEFRGRPLVFRRGRATDPRRMIAIAMNLGRLLVNTASRRVGSPRFWRLFDRVAGRLLNSYRLLMWYFARPTGMSALSRRLLRRFPWRASIAVRQGHERLYREGLNVTAFRPLMREQGLTHASMGYAVAVEDRDALVAALESQGVRGIFFEHRWDYFPSGSAHDAGRWVMAHHFLLPTSYALSVDEVRSVIAAANAWAARQRDAVFSSAP